MSGQARVARFLDEWQKMRGRDPSLIYTLHHGTDKEASLTVEDLHAMQATIDAQAARIAELEAEVDALRSVLKPRIRNITEDQNAAAWAAWDDTLNGEMAMDSALEASHLIFVRRALKMADDTRQAWASSGHSAALNEDSL